MKKFLIKTALFIIPFILIGIGIECITRKMPNDYKIKNTYLNKNAENINILILGNSHAYYGLNPSYFTQTGFNAAYISQSIDLDNKILDKYKNRFSNLNTIILPLSTISLTSRMSSNVEAWRLKNYVIYYNFENTGAISNHFEIFSNKFQLLFKKSASYVMYKKSGITSDQYGWGNDYSSDNHKNLESSGRLAASRHNKNIKDNDIIDNINKNIIDLNNIAKWAEDNNIALFLITLPCHQTYIDKINTDQINLVFSEGERLSKLYKNTHYLNLLRDTNFYDADFYDADHLNEKGAEKLSRKIDYMISAPASM